MKRTILFFLVSLLLRTAVWATIVAGQTEGIFSVSPSGAATYQIPITTLQGLSTFVPEVSLCYDSQSGNGIAGYGWSLGGFHSISAVPRSVYFDGQAECLYQGGDNALALDGMRLLLKSGTNGTVGAVYCTENDQGALIEITSCTNGTPASFTVTGTDGTTYKYGSATGRRLSDNGEVYGWALDYAEDALGNYISYTYAQEGVLYPLSITYGKNVHGSKGVSCTISFGYEDREDSISSYMPGSLRYLTKRLSKITCQYGQYTYRTYDLIYSNGQFSHLTSVTETGLSSSSYHPTTFTWQGLPGISLSCEPKTMEAGLLEDVDKEYYFSGDVDGDGLTEAISMGQRTVGGRPYVYFEGRKWDAESRKFKFCLSGTTQASMSLRGMNEVLRSIQDGGLCMHANHREGNSVVFPYLDIQDGHGYMEFQFIRERQTLNYPLTGPSRQMPCYAILDADRDGLDEIFLLEKAQAAGAYPAHLIKCNLSDGSLIHETVSLTLPGAPSTMACADFNMDGMPDILVCTPDAHCIYWNRDGHFSDTDRYAGTAFGACDMLRVGDFNGDGLPDLLINKKNSSDWSIAENTGRDEDNYFTMYPIGYMSRLGLSAGTESKFSCQVQDLDGDGRSDVVVGYARPSKAGVAQGHLCILQPEGDSLRCHSTYTFDNEEGFPDAAHIIQGDFDGHGAMELAYWGHGLEENQNTTGWYMLKNALLGASSNRIVSITNGLGAKDSITYGLLCDRDVYSVDGAHAFPVARLAGAFPVVTSHTESIATDSRNTDYQYRNGYVHLQGKGFLGFEDVRTTSSTGIVTDSHATLDSTYYILIPQSSTVSNAEGVPISSETYKVSYNKVGSHAYTLWQNSLVTRDLLSGFVKSEDYQGYKNGSPTSVTLSDDLFTSEQEITLWESPLEDVWIKGLPAKIDIVRSAAQPDAEDVHESVIYERDPATGLVLKETRKRNGQTVSTKGYSYNEYGQVTRCYTSAYGSPDTLQTSYTYNANGQVQTETDSKGITKHYLYYTQHGMVRSVTDPTSVRTQFSYDGMLRKTREYSPTETSTWSYQFSTYGGAVYSVTEREAGMTPVITYYDAWNRKVAEGKAQAVGSYQYRNYHYLPNGKLGFESFPHGYAKECTEGITYHYDGTHRLTASTDSNGKTSTWSYGLTQTTSCIDGVSRTTYYYTPDLVATIEDEAGYADYEYDTDGNVKTIYTESSQANYDYDTYGRLVRTVDMNGAVKEYAYDRNGFLKSKKTGDGIEETVYDKNGIIKSVTWTDPGRTPRTTRYTYDKFWRLTGEESTDYAFTYTYDQHGRIFKKGRLVRGNSDESLEVQYTYGTDNQIARQVSHFGNLPSYISEKYEYNNGYLVGDSLGDALAWRMNSQDRWGNPTKTSGASAVTSLSYDDYGHLTSLDKNGENTLHESYAYDILTGNMCSRNGVSLTYDGMNRLTGWGNHSLSYDSRGNITHMPQVGDFTYDGYRTTGLNLTSSDLDMDDSLQVSYYNSMERPRRIENSRYRADFKYDGNGERLTMSVYEKRNGTFTPTFTRYYLDANAEVTVYADGRRSHLYYVGGDCYTAPAMQHFNEEGDSCLYQITRDPLGSVLEYEGSGRRPYRISYSPWGARTHNGEDGTLYAPGENPPIEPFCRTYTGHEDLWMFGLVNANARLYDPYSGRFISPDPLLNSEGGSLLYNPYVYANNNPYRYIDRTGEYFWWIAAAAIFSGGCNVMANFDDIDNAGDFFKYFGVGAAAGALSAVIGPYAVGALGISGAGFFSGAAAGAVTGVLSSQLQAGMNYAFLGTPYSFNWQAFIMQTAISSVIGGFAGGIQAKINGKNFWNGRQNIIPSQALETPSEKIEAMVAGIDRKDLTPHELGKIGEDLAEEEMKSQGIRVIGRHFAYRVEGLDGYGFTDVVGEKNGRYYIWEAKNSRHPKFTNFQNDAKKLMEMRKNIWFFGPKAIREKLPLEPFNNYDFEIKPYVVPK